MNAITSDNAIPPDAVLVTAYKTCNKCREAKPATDEFFQHLSQTEIQRRTHYLAPTCRKCRGIGVVDKRKVRERRRQGDPTYAPPLFIVPDHTPKQCTKCGEFKPNIEEFFRHKKDTAYQRKTHYLSAKCRTCDTKVATAWQKRNPGRAKAASLKRKYGIDKREYEAMADSQDGKCLICERAPIEKYGKSDFLCVDHDHSTGEIRGLLCTRCNLALSGFLDSKKLLKKALEYLGDE